MENIIKEQTEKLQSLPPLREILKKHNLVTKKKLGQNFIFDLNLTGRIARVPGNLNGKIILEIGPGPGGLTRAILCNEARKIIAIEHDKNCIPALAELRNIVGNRLDIINDDALNIKISSLIIQGNRLKIIANLPYNIGTELLFRWFDELEYIESMTLMFQKEVADRITASPKTKAYGIISVIAQFLCETRKEFDVNPSAFFPPPKITSSVVTLIPRAKPLADIDINILKKICKTTFGQRRKTLRSSLKNLVNNPTELLDNAGINPQSRPEELSILEFCKLSSEFSDLP